MKKYLTAVFSIGVLSLAAAVLPEKWDIEFFNLDEKSFLKGLNIVGKPQKITLSEKAFDLTGVSQGSDNAAIRTFIQSGKDQTVWLAVGCKVFSLSLNGKMIYDFREYGLGNDLDQVTAGDHVIPLELKSGRNEILFSSQPLQYTQTL